MGIQVDLILFHPYDRWGFAAMSQHDNLVYLDYLLRRFLRNLLSMSPIDIERHIGHEISICGHYKQEAYLYYYDIQQFAESKLELPEERTYRIDVIDAWNMTRETVRTGERGTVDVKLPSREYMAVLAVAEPEQ